MLVSRKDRVWFEITDRCNLNCAFCYKKASQAGATTSGPLKDGLHQAIVDELISQRDVGVIALTGGEPLLYRGFFQLISRIHRHNIPLILATNGTLLNRRVVDNCLGSGVVSFQMPVLSASKHIHNILAGRDIWDNVIKSIALVREAGGHVTLVFVATRKNLDQFCGVLEIAALFKIKTVIFNRCTIHIGLSSTDEYSVDDEVMQKTILKDAQIADKHGIRIVLGTPIILSKTDKHIPASIELASCPIADGQNQYVVDFLGDVRGCLLSRAVLGNILQQEIETILKEKWSVYHHSRERIDGIHPCCLC
jgi:MoaA/NifB/PqqE/SkfB family radical SAM enzyme